MIDAHLDDVLLRLHDEVAAADPAIQPFAALDAERILEGKVSIRWQDKFVRICQDLRLPIEEIDRLLRKVWDA